MRNVSLLFSLIFTKKKLVSVLSHQIITGDELDDAVKLIRPNPCEPIIRKDKERKPTLIALVKILEINDNLPEKDLNAWVESIKI